MGNVADTLIMIGFFKSSLTALGYNTALSRRRIKSKKDMAPKT
jgi:hypothetical protein